MRGHLLLGEASDLDAITERIDVVAAHGLSQLRVQLLQDAALEHGSSSHRRPPDHLSDGGAFCPV